MIATSVAISVAILMSPCRKGPGSTSSYESSIYPVGGGWGYDIVIRDSVFIHQESMPSLEGNKPFINRKQATEAARLVISKLNKGDSPSFSRSEIERIILSQ